MRKTPLLPLALLACACATTESSAPGDTVHAARADAAPVLDGSTDEDAWRDAAATTVALDGTTGPDAANVRAVVHGDTLYVAVRWADTTEDREHKVWAPKAGGGFEAGPEREDVLAVAFPVAGEFTANMVSPVDCTWDVWQWKSARTDPAGFAMDKSHLNTLADPGGKHYEAKLADGRSVYIRRPEDAGRSATKTLKAPAEGAARAPQYEAQAPDGSAADVTARGRWSDGHWTVELARRLSTGHPDDADLAGRDAVKFAIAVLDRGEDEDHAASGVLTLVLR